MTFEIFPYAESDLPDGFKYPAEYLEFISKHQENLYPWWFISSESEIGKICLSTMKSQPKILVPFAKTDLYDDIACFDGSNNFGNPSIIMVCSTPERSYGFTNFNEWLVQAKLESSEVAST